MGSTGAHRGGIKDIGGFGINGANEPSKDKLKEAGFDKPGNRNYSAENKANKGEDIIFQFTLVGKNKMSIKAYQPGTPAVKALVKVDANNPSLDSTTSSGGEVQKLRALFAKSKSGVKESNLPSIAAELKRRNS